MLKPTPCSTSSSSSSQLKLSNKSENLSLRNSSIKTNSKKMTKSGSRIMMSMNSEVMIKSLMSFLMEKLRFTSLKKGLMSHKFNLK